MSQSHVVVTGANRGIGLEFVMQYLATGAKVTATARSFNDAEDLKGLAVASPHLSLLELDVTDNVAIENFVSQIDTPIDCLVNNAGIYGGTGQNIANVDKDTWLQTLNTNTLGPFFVTRALLSKMNKQSWVAFVTSKMGSITDNSSGGAYIYRASKAALNALVKSLSIDLAEREISTVLLHPGWVKTRMGGDNALITTEQSVSGLIQVIDKLTVEQNGKFYAYDGQEIPW